MAFKKSIIDKYPNVGWGNLDDLSEKAVEELGLNGALHEARFGSPHLRSSGRTSSIQRNTGRKGRNAHYKRKGELEGKKEATRRATWLRRHPGASESNWIRREAVRKTRKAAERAHRKAEKAAKA
jgi:hypothetical protein